MNAAYDCLDGKSNPVTPCTPVGECHQTDDFLRDVKSCSTFYRCFAGLEKLGKFECDTGLVFNTNTHMCDWPRNFKCL